MENAPSLDDTGRWLDEALAATRAYTRVLRDLASAVDSRIDAQVSAAPTPVLTVADDAHVEVTNDREVARPPERLRQLRARLGLALHYADMAGEHLLPALTWPSHGAGPTEASFLGSLEEERYRLARDIHDGPAQVLANAVLELQYCERLLTRNPSAIPGELAQLEASLRDGLVEVRRLIFDLRPPALVELGLSASLQRYAEEFRERARVEVTVSIPEIEERLTPVQEAAVFRIVQEALQNVHKHAGAKRVWLRVLPGPTDWVVEVADDGNGFVTMHTENGRPTLGLTSMRERAQAIGARLEVSSATGEGTTITVVVPRHISRQP
ncbi:MAG: sensor histidine kinase [Chloroflexota bacterium]